jgi:hypothetical protein
MRQHHAVVVSTRLSDSEREILWELYFESFEPFRERALLNHLYSREQFDELIANDKVIKIVARTDGRPVGLALVTTDLDAVPQISPPFLRRRYPEHAARDAIFFGIMVFVGSSNRRTSLYAKILAAAGQIIASKSGVGVFDVSNFGRTIGVHAHHERVSFRFTNSSFEEIDRQTYFAVHLPEPLTRLPFGGFDIDLTAQDSGSVGGSVLDLGQDRSAEEARDL